MPHYPLLFTSREKVSGTRFLAEVTLSGRLLASHEDGGWWMYGVEPGGLAAGGKTPGEAYSDFQRTLRSVLFDIAADVKTFDEFRLQVREFFRDKNGPAEADWNQAVKDVRSGAVREDGIPVENNPIKRLPADTKRSVSVKLLKTVTATPKDNKVDPPFAVAA